MRGDGVPVAPGMLDGEAVAGGIMKAEGAILGLFQDLGGSSCMIKMRPKLPLHGTAEK